MSAGGTLVLEPRRGMRRRMVVLPNQDGRVSVALFLVSRRKSAGYMIAFASAYPEAVRLQGPPPDDPTGFRALKVGCSSFDVTAEEAELIASTLGLEPPAGPDLARG